MARLDQVPGQKYGRNRTRIPELERQSPIQDTGPWRFVTPPGKSRRQRHVFLNRRGHDRVFRRPRDDARRRDDESGRRAGEADVNWLASTGPARLERQSFYTSSQRAMEAHAYRDINKDLYAREMSHAEN
jgi:hypothetical protein